MLAGMALLALPAGYAAVMGWLRGGLALPGHLTPLAPLSCGEGGTSSSS